MSKSIDERVVEMKFDNADFERNVQQSIRTLDQLDKSLDLSNSTRGLDNLQKAADSFDLGGMTTACGKVGDSFNALQVIATGALLEIGAQALRTGENLVNSLVVDQVSAGWEKYAEKTTAVQTIMSATADQFEDTGEQMEYVNEQLEKLNWFTDETSYNFTDMTNNIGKFTSAGIDLETSVSAMQGIATATSMAGQNAQAASRVMYNFSQSLGAGAVKLQDWMSIENANIATKEFKETIIETAKELGNLDKKGKILKKTTDKYSGDEFVDFQNFRNTLSAGWFDSDVLIKALEKYGNFAMKLNDFYEELDGEVLTSQLIRYVQEYKDGTIDLDEAMKETGMNAETLKARLDELGSKENELGFKSFKAAQEAKTFAEAMDATKDAVSTIWMNIFEDIFGNYEEAKVLWTDLAEFLYDVFAQPMQNLEDLLDGWAEMGGRDDIVAIFGNFEEAIESLLEIVGDAWNEIFPEESRLNGLKSFTELLVKITEKMKPSKETADKLGRTLKGLFAILDIGKKAIKSIFNMLKPLIGESFSITDGILNLTASIGDFFVQLDSGIGVANTFSEMMETVHDTLQKVFDDLPSMSEFFEQIKNSYDEMGGGFLEGVFNVIADQMLNLISYAFDLAEAILGIDLSGFEESVLTSISNVTDRIGEFIRYNIPGLKDELNYIWDTFEEAGGGFKGVLEVIHSIMYDLVFDALEFVSALTNIDMSNVESNIKKVLDNIHDTIIGFAEDPGIEAFSDNLGAVGDTFEKSYSVLSTVGKEVGDILKKIFQNIKEAFTEDTFGTLKKVAETGVLSTLAYGIKTLADSIKKFMEKSEKSKGGPSFTDMLGEVKNVLVEYQKSIKSHAIIEIAIALGILVGSLVALSTVDGKKLAEASAAIGGVAIELVGAMITLNKFATGVKLGGSVALAIELVAFASAVGKIGNAIKNLSDIPWDRLLESTIAASAVLWELVGVAKAMQSSKTSITQSIAIAIEVNGFAIALGKIAKAIDSLSDITWDRLLASTVAISAVLWELVGVAKVLGNGKTSSFITAAISVTIMAEGVKALAKPIREIGEMDLASIIKGVGGISVLLWEMAGLIKLFNGKVDRNIAAIGGAIFTIAYSLKFISEAIKMLDGVEPESIGISLLAITTGLVAIAAALSLLSWLSDKFNTGGKKFLAIGVTIAIVADSLKSIAAAIKKLAGYNLKEIGAGMLAVYGGLVLIATVLGVMSSIKSIKESKMLAIAASITIIAKACETLAKAFVKMKDISWDQLLASSLALVGVLGILSSIAALLGSFVGPEMLIGAAAMIVIAEACNIVASAFVKFTEGIVNITTAIIQFVEALAMLSKMSDEDVDQVINNLHRLIDESPVLLTQAIAAICEAIIVNAVNISNAFWSVVLEISNKMLEAKPKLVQNAYDTIIAILTTIREKLPEVIDLAADVVVAFIEGMASHISEVAQAGTDLMVAVIGAVVEQRVELTQAGIDAVIEFIDGLANTIETKEPELKAAIEHLFTACIDAAKDILFGEKSINDFIEGGKNLIRGFINGVANKALQSELLSTIAGVGAMTLSSMQKSLKERSPSRATDQMGQYFDMGLINGIRRLSGDVVNSAEELGNDTVDSLSNALSYIPDVDEISDDLVITPVLDLTNVKNGANELNNMLNSDNVIKASTGFDYANYTNKQATEIQNGLMMDRLLSLQSALDKMSENNASEVPINLNVSLEGDADGIFRVVQNENNRFAKQTGRSAFA